ncbi:MAG TPA: NADH-quinone oxidoreductase subunit NuoG [Terriglobales bacterium]|nr:NADH-quinone oxidoreductase subunit NuoG [Terriglobales bacterium]
MADVTITVDGQKITAPAGTLLIEACKTAGIEIPSFCYYPGLSLQAACRMCVVRIEKMPKLQTACTVPITEGMVVTNQSDEVKQARKATIELLLGNHPLDCPVCDAGGECELQDMTFTYGAAESKHMEVKAHKDEQQWSPVVYFDRPRCILCYRCVRVCGEVMDVWALGVQNRGVGSVIAPNKGDHLECEECGQCIDICPVGALTSGAYRYKTRPWEMNHVGTVCTHCGDGCKTTLGVRRSETGTEIVRGDNRDKSGINGDFLCIKGRYAFDFQQHPDRLKQPLIRKDGKLKLATWEETFETIGQRFNQIKKEQGGAGFGVIGSTRTTNEENYLLQKFARTVIGTNNIDHHRTADFPAFAAAISGKPEVAGSLRDVETAPVMLLIGNDPTEQHPLLAVSIRNNVRLHGGKLFIVNHDDIKLLRQAKAFAQIPAGSYGKFIEYLGGDDSAASAFGDKKDSINAMRDALRKAVSEAGDQVIIMFGSEIRGADVAALVKVGLSHKGAKFLCLADYANSRGAADMGLYPDLLPGYTPVGKGSSFTEEYGPSSPNSSGMDLSQMIDAAKSGKLGAMYIVAANPAARFNLRPGDLQNTFLVVQDMFLTETASMADVVLPAANAYEKAGTFTNSYGDLQLLKKAGDFAGCKSDFELIVRIADRMGADVPRLVPFGAGLRADFGQTRGAQSGEADRHETWLISNNVEPKVSPFDPATMLDEIQRLVPGYDFSRINLLAGNDVHTHACGDGAGASQKPEAISPANDTLFTSGTLGRFSNTLNSVMEAREIRNPASGSEVMAD